MREVTRFLYEHQRLTRRFFVQLGLGGVASLGVLHPPALGADPLDADGLDVPELAAAIDKLESYFTKLENFRDVSRGKPIPHTLPEDKKQEAGLTRDTWRLEIASDPEHAASIRTPFTKAAGTAIDFKMLMQIAEAHAVRFPKVMTCLNIGCPLGMGLWEGVPLRELIWRTQPRENLRRVFYYGFHNDDPSQRFQSSLPIGRVLEDPFDLPPVIVCYKLNGQWLTSERGGPVRLVVPEAYGFKSVKWLSNVVLTNLAHANDTYAGGNNDIDSPLKSFAATLSFPPKPKVNERIPVTGYAQVGISGVSKVQVWIQPNSQELPSGDPHYLRAPWVDATLLPPPKSWGGDLPDDRFPAGTHGVDASGQPKVWPMRLCKVHWAALLPGLPEGKYTLRCRTVDDKGITQPLPRPFRKSGHAAIEEVSLTVS